MFEREIIPNLLAAIDAVNPRDISDNPEYDVEYEEQSFFNIKADSMERGRGFVLIHELERGEYIFRRGYHRRKRFFVRIYFGKWSPFNNQVSHGTTPYSERTEQVGSAGVPTRQEIRQSIEEEIVYPFIKEIENHPKQFAYIETWGFSIRYVCSHETECKVHNTPRIRYR